MAALEFEGVRKTYGEVVALSGLDLTVEEGEIFGFLGPNGAGKTTAIDVALDFARPDEGTATVLGHDAQREARAVRERTGVLPEDAAVYERLTGRQHVEFVVESRGAADEPAAVLDHVGLTDAADRPAGDYSEGMRQRLLLGMALVGEPDLLVLDEPSSGLDPNGARELRDIVRKERDRGATVVFSSHSLDQVEAVCDRVGILDGGDLVAVDTIEGLREAMDAETTLRITLDAPCRGVGDAVASVEGVTSVETDGTRVVVNCGNDVKMDVLAAIEAAGGEVDTFDTETASLAELFAAYTEGEAAPA